MERLKQFNRKNNNDDDDYPPAAPPLTPNFNPPPPPYILPSSDEDDSDIVDDLNPTKKKLDFRKILANYFQRLTIFLIIKKLVLMLTFLN